jgi:pimeloyl-ACP methyl ester carboxylesterase
MLARMMPTTLSRSGVEIAYRTAGGGSVNVLFMHGWAGSGAYFDATIEHLDLSRLRAITFDFRGHGDSGKTEHGYALDDLADDVIAAADATGADSFVLVGFSMSGKFAQYVSCRHPERVLGQILIAGCPVGEVPLPAELLADWYAREGSAERMIEIVETYATQPIAPDALARLGRDAARVPLIALRGTMNAVTSTSFVDRICAASVPTLVVGGLRDQIFNPEALRESVVAPLPDARLELLDCGHEIPLEQPRDLAQLIDRFASAVAEAGDGRARADSGRHPTVRPAN